VIAVVFLMAALDYSSGLARFFGEIDQKIMISPFDEWGNARSTFGGMRFPVIR
jgi:hypothetical protein